MKRNNLFLLSFLSTNYTALRKHWEKYSVLLDNGKRGSDRVFKGYLGGKVVLLDWESKRFVWEIDIDSPSGMLLENDKLFINSLNLGKIIVVDYFKRMSLYQIDNNLFNKPHSLIKTRNGFLVSSTGIDTIIEVDRWGNTLFEYCFIDNGYPFDQFGKRRKLDKSINHQTIVYPSLNQTTHVNFAKYVNYNEKEIIATLFHTGEVVRIKKDTGEIEVLLKDLNHPHNINDFSSSEYLIADSDNNRAITVDKNSLKIRLEFKDNSFSWIQDAVRVVNHVFMADADNCRIVKMDFNNKIVDSFSFSRNYRVFQVLPL